ncbi:hypothetical protein [Haloarcula argentinensis]|uniref:Uncharacterized protein n=1 Tax=Haloarcula argentinensis TaxID=43776 RepID=A0A847UL02_HALAR|nr:hypothetical protein [Haloarcula argentinensis]NLV14329.1 hypothetical protein [Haloarcula argentinensis]
MRVPNPSEDLLKAIFDGYGPVPVRHYWALRELLQKDILSLHKDTYYGGEISKSWAAKHISPGNTDSAETRSHFKKKIKGARFLDRRGHEMEKKPLSDTDTGKLFTYTAFENNFEGLNADVTCSDSCCNSLLEAGYIKPDRVLTMFGYRTVDTPEHLQKYNQPTELSVRHEPRKLNEFHVFPYPSGETDSNNIFTVKPESLPEPVSSITADEITNAFKDE